MAAAEVVVPVVPPVSEIVVWESPCADYESVRIPAIVKTTKGTLLAFAEGRVNGTSRHF